MKKNHTHLSQAATAITSFRPLPNGTDTTNTPLDTITPLLASYYYDD
jgi:hypothetical protein